MKESLKNDTKKKKIHESRSWFFEKIEIDKPLTRFINRKGERAQINKIRKKVEK